jgi:hypothetical protein
MECRQIGYEVSSLIHMARDRDLSLGAVKQILTPKVPYDAMNCFVNLRVCIPQEKLTECS